MAADSLKVKPIFESLLETIVLNNANLVVSKPHSFFHTVEPDSSLFRRTVNEIR